jgi:NlpC/P60 family putative phage cell wall peptidase
VSAESEQREAVVAEARTWMHTPYHHHARIKGVGVDCAQLLCAVFEAVGLVPPVDTGFYAHDWHLHRNEEEFSAWLAKFARLMPPGAIKEAGDVILWRFGRTFSHGSIHVGEGLLIHSYIERGVIASRFDEEPLEGREMQHWSFWK